MSSLPPLNSISNGTPADATEVDQNFDTLATFVDTELVNRDGSVAMAAELTLSSSTPSGALVAASKGYVDAAAGSATPADGSVTTAKLDDGAVTTAKIGAGAVTDAKIADFTWTQVTYQNGWASTAGGLYYTKIGNIVILQGNITGSSASNSVMCTLPADYRPVAQSYFWSSITPGSIRVNTNGTVETGNGNIPAAGTWRIHAVFRAA